MERDASFQEQSAQRATTANDEGPDRPSSQPADEARRSEEPPVSGERPSYPPPPSDDALTVVNESGHPPPPSDDTATTWVAPSYVEGGNDEPTVVSESSPPPSSAAGVPDVDRGVAKEGSVAALLPPGVGRRFGRYELLGRFAQGGMAEIYLARQVAADELERYLVVKCICPVVADDESFLRMFKREARLALQLKHPHICHIYEYGRQEGRYFLAMEWVEGASLLDALHRAGHRGEFLPAPVVVDVVARIASALDHAHRAHDRHGRPLGVVHRDVSPQNVAIAYDGTVKLLDFGVAKVHAEGTQTQPGTVAGKFAYMTPEQCRDEPLDGRCDVFALGVVLCEALTGYRLYNRSTPYETFRAICEDPVPSVRDQRPGLPEALDMIVRRALAKDRNDRFATAGNMAVALQQYLTVRGEMVTAADVADMMAVLFEEDIRRGLPELEVDTELMRSLEPMNEPAEPAEESVRRGEGEPGDSRAPPAEASADGTPSANPAFLKPGPFKVVPARALRWVEERPGSALGAAAGMLLLLGGGAFVTGLAAGDHDEGDAGDTELGRAAAAPVRQDVREDTSGPSKEAEGEPPSDPAPAEPSPDPAPAELARPILRVETDPPGARVVLDDEKVDGRTPLDLDDVAPGNHFVRLRRAGYADWEGPVEVPASGSAVLARALQARGAARVNINTRPWSRIYVGQRLLGTTPIADARVPAGRNRLRLVDRDGQEHRRWISVPRGEEESLFYDLRE